MDIQQSTAEKKRKGTWDNLSGCSSNENVNLENPTNQNHAGNERIHPLVKVEVTRKLSRPKLLDTTRTKLSTRSSEGDGTKYNPPKSLSGQTHWNDKVLQWACITGRDLSMTCSKKREKSKRWTSAWQRTPYFSRHTRRKIDSQTQVITVQYYR